MHVDKWVIVAVVIVFIAMWAQLANTKEARQERKERQELRDILAEWNLEDPWYLRLVKGLGMFLFYGVCGLLFIGLIAFVGLLFGGELKPLFIVGLAGVWLIYLIWTIIRYVVAGREPLE